LIWTDIHKEGKVHYSIVNLGVFSQAPVYIEVRCFVQLGNIEWVGRDLVFKILLRPHRKLAIEAIWTKEQQSVLHYIFEQICGLAHPPLMERIFAENI